MRAALIVASYFLALCWPHSVTAQDWPTRTVLAVVPLPAGTSVDSMARIVMQQLAQQVGQSFVVENKPGAGGTIGTKLRRQGAAGWTYAPRVWCSRVGGSALSQLAV